MSSPIDLPLLLSEQDCTGRIFIVTGANTGLGYETTKHLVALGSRTVILAVRNPSSGEEAKAEIEETTGKSGIAQVWQLDLASYDSVKAFSERAEKELESIDGLIENAGINIGRDVMAEGHPATFTINIYSTFLLLDLLLPKMSADAKRLGTTPHATIVTSSADFRGQSQWEAVKDDANQ